MKMDNRKKIALRLGCALLAIVLAAALLPQLGTKANAATSLKHIEEIKKTYKTLQILELVPQTGTGSIGYYIAGQEPTANWRSEVSKLGTVTDAEGNVTKTGTQARTEYVGALVNSLRARGLLNTDASDSGNYPLSYTAAYAELYPWSGSVPEGYVQLQLKDASDNTRYEAATVKGEFTYSAGTGTFSAVNGSAIFKPGKNGSYDQNVDYFLYGQPESGDTATYYYYAPTFGDKINIPANRSAEIEQYAGKALYQETTGTNTDGTTYTYKKYVGTVGLDYRMLTDTDYYTSTSSGNGVSNACDAEHPYRAIANAAQPFKPVTTGGYFDVPVDSYMYIGTGGDYVFTPNSASSEKTLLYSYIYVTGGYTNNNWFLKYVFDMTDEDIKNTQLTVKVYSIVPSASNESTILSLLDTVDMTSVSAGFNIGTGGTAADYSADITANELSTIESARKDKNRAVLIDSRLAGSAMQNVKKLSRDLMLNTSEDAASYGFVSGSLYYYVPYSVKGGSSFAAIATKDFNQKFASSLSTDDSDPFYEVKSNIVYTNFLRDKSGITNDDLSLDISMAACIRHIINYYDQISVYTKDALRVLDIEPLTQLTDETQSKKLTKTTVESWLPEGCAIKANTNYPGNITITTWSTAEFISRINDINDDFDLVYVGSSLDNFTLNSAGTAPKYNDTDMNGLIYSNIGDTQKKTGELTNKFVGLVDSDYSAANVPNLSKTSNIYRLSGNDITKIKSEELKNFASSGLPIVVADNIINAPKEAIPACDFSVTASVGNVKKTNSGYTVDLTATPAVTAGTVPANITYAWSYSSNGHYYQSVPGAGKSKTLTYSTSTPEGYYYCTATTTYARDGVQYNATCTSNTVYLGNDSIGISLSYLSWADHYYLLADIPEELSYSTVKWYVLSKAANGEYWKYFDHDIYTSNISSGKTYLCRVISGGKSYFSQKVTPSWNKWGSNLAGSEISGVQFFYDVYVSSNIYNETISTYKNWSTQSYNNSVSVPIPEQNAVSTASVNSSTVDCNSIMYSTLKSVVGKANVMTATQAYDNKATLIKYVNLSKPNIVFATAADKPTEYTDLSKISGGTSLISGNTLKYTFTISNPTDPTPYTTEYTCGLYIDLNADGRYSADEEISDLAVTSTDESTGTAKTADGTHLKQGVKYTVMRELPHKYSGIIPWCLKVTQNGTDGQVRTSSKGYTFAMPQERTKIKILQITSKSGETGKTFGLKYYNGLDYTGRDTHEQYYLNDFKELYNKNLYDITVDTVSVSDLNNNALYANQKAVEDKFFQYNMLILGFGDGYGWSETGGGLLDNAAKALVTFIKSGQAVLFTHDTTSFVNLPADKATYNSTNGKLYCGYAKANDWYWGYYFNDVIRDSVGLDRYGVTNEEFGVSKYSYLYNNASNTSTYAGYVAGGYSDSSVNFSDAAKLITSKDYSIAYKPQKDTTQATQRLMETQGYTNQQLLNSGGGNTPINTISQVNKGQITTYPYNINTKNFGGDEKGDITVGVTHEQYYQLNMNSDEIVVWYCLSGDFSTNYKNDGTNAYYIYNRGNVTYSGAGHDPYNTTAEEAKLFVNTMIAAYRAAATPPDISFKTADGTTNLTSQILPVTFADESSTSSAAGTATENSRVYFRVNDTNLVSNKTVTAKFYYYDGSRTLVKDESDALAGGTKTPEAYGFKPLTVDMYSASTEAKVYDSKTNTWSPKSLNSSTLYYLVLPDDIAGTASASVTLLGLADTAVVQQTKTLHYFGVATMNLQKLGYRLLR